MSSRGSVSSRSPTPRKSLNSANIMGEIRFDILEQNNIFNEEDEMDEERWFDLAFSLGMPTKEAPRFNAETQKLTQKTKRRKLLSESQALECLKPFIKSITNGCPMLSQQSQRTFHSDAVPTLECHRNTIYRLPTPKPCISIGYNIDAFSSDYDELQNGIIAGPLGEPYDLNHVSQPVTGHFWPFFIVETSDVSMEAAQQATAISAATCNHALSLLVSAAAISDREWTRTGFKFDSKFLRTFSLSVHGKMACLSAHTLRGSAPHVVSPISTYQLDNDHDVACLADRIHNIVFWGQHNRLGEITATLDQLDHKVHGSPSRSAMNEDTYEFDPSCLKGLKLGHPRRPDRMKTALKSGLPRWLAR